MPVTPAANALTEIEAVRRHMRRPQNWPQDEKDLVQDLINAYSTQIIKYCDRQFAKEDGASKRFRYEGNGMLSLGPWELRNVQSLTLYTDMPQSAWTVLAEQAASSEAQYRLEPRQRTLEGTYLWLALPEIGMYSPLVPEPLVTRRARGHELTIVGDWGIGSIPPDVALACRIAVANAARNPNDYASMSMGGISFAEVIESGAAEGMALPRGARSLLYEYRRSSYA